MKKVQFYKHLSRKTDFFEVWSSFKFSCLGLLPGMALKFYESVAKRFKLNFKVLRAKFYVWRNCRGKMLGNLFAPPPYCIVLLKFYAIKTNRVSKLIYLSYQGRMFIYYFLEVPVHQKNIEKELKDVRKDIRTVEGKQEQMGKKIAQMEESFAKHQSSRTNPEVPIPGELYLVYFEYFHELCRQPKKFENRTQLMDTNIN